MQDCLSCQSERELEMQDFEGGDMTFAPGLSSTVNFTALARLASTPFGGSGAAAVSSLPQPPGVSFIKPVDVTAAVVAVTACETISESSSLPVTSQSAG